MTSFSATITHDPDGTAGTLTLDNSSNATRITSRKYQRTENHPATVTLTLYNEYATDTTNILHSSFAGWSAGTGAIALGDALNYSMCPTSFTTGAEGALTEYFYGRITDIRSTGPNELEITARDMLYRYEQVQYSQTFYNLRKDWEILPIEFLSAAPHLGKFCANGVQTTGAYPAAALEILTDDSVMTYGLDITDDGTSAVDLDTVGDKAAQPFIAEHDAIYAIGLRLGWLVDAGATDPNIYRFSIQGDNGSNRPDGTELYGFEIYHSETSEAQAWRDFYWNDGYAGEWDSTDDDPGPVMDDPVVLTKGRKYWLVAEFHATDATYPGAMYMRYDNTGAYLGGQSTANCWFYDASVATWSSLSGSWDMFLLGGQYTNVPGSNHEYYYDGAEGNLVVNKFDGTMPMGDTGVAQFDKSLWSEYDLRARCSYYYSHLDLDDMIERVVELDPDILDDNDASADLAIPVYRTTGKYLGDCLRELCDLYGYSYLSGYRQLSMYAYHSGGVDYVAWGRRKIASETAIGTVGDGKSGLSDVYVRLISADLRKSSTRRPGTIRVIGKSSDGTPLVATRSDRATASAYHDQIGFYNVQTINDESLNTLQQVNDKAWYLLDASGRDTWEGTITASGCFPQAFSVAAGTEGSGESLNVYYDPLNLSGTNFKIKAVETDGYSTTFTVTTEPDMDSNAIRRLNASVRQLDSFRTDIDTPDTYHVYVYKATDITDATCYIQLSGAVSGTAITGHTRVAATQLTMPTGVADYDSYVYYAVVEPDNGYGEVGVIDLYAAATGGSPLAYHDFSSDSTLRRDFYKSKSMRVIVEFHVKVG